MIDETLYTLRAADAPEVVTGDYSSKVEAWNTYAVVLAEKLELPISFRYVKSLSEDPATRRLRDIEVKVNVSGDLLVVGSDPDRSDTRSFRVDRITDYIQIDD